MLLAGPALGDAKTAEDYFQQGEAALEQGNLATARSAYTQALRLNPQHGNARFRLLSLKDVAGEAKVKIKKRQLAKIRLKQVNFEDTPLREVLQDLGVMIEQASEEEFIPNFVLDDSSSGIADNKINLRLRNIPASAVLDYVLSQGKARAVWSEHAIAIRPMGK